VSKVSFSDTTKTTLVYQPVVPAASSVLEESTIFANPCFPRLTRRPNAIRSGSEQTELCFQSIMTPYSKHRVGLIQLSLQFSGSSSLQFEFFHQLITK
jgi:hypothetical protein